MRKLVFIFLTVLATQSFGQDYSPIYTSSNKYYQFDTNTTYHNRWLSTEALAEKIDSFSLVGSDTILYPFQRIKRDHLVSFPGLCLTLNDTSWLGSFIIKKNDSTIFHNRLQESILIENPRTVNQKWVLFEYSNNNYIEAEVISLDTMSIQSSLDSVATLSLTLRDSLNNQVTSNINSKTIIISKNKGIIQGFNWHDFPYDGIDKQFKHLSYNKLTRADVFDFNIGDEFHYEYWAGQVPPLYKLSTVTGKKVISTDSIEYIFSNINESSTVDFSTSPPTQIFTVSTVIDTIIYDNLSQIISNVIPRAAFLSGSAPMFELRELYINVEHYNGRQTEAVKDVGFYFPDSICYIASFNLVNTYEYIKGCGITHVMNDLSQPFMNLTQELIYFKKGTETWGSPHILTGIENNELKNKRVKVFPNPTNQSLNITTENDVFQTFEIYGINGKRVLSKTLNNSTSVDVSKLKSGIYLLKLIGKEEIIQRKFVKN